LTRSISGGGAVIVPLAVDAGSPIAADSEKKLGVAVAAKVKEMLK
jgi:hypothetical protein